jgi:protein arginine kinase
VSDEYLQNFLDKPLGEWLKSEGADSDVVISTRVRLARNIAEFPFTGRANEKQKSEILGVCEGAVEGLKLEGKMHAVHLPELDEQTRDILIERHLISRELSNADGPRGVVFDQNERLSLMINEEDHLRAQSICSGFDVQDAFESICNVDRQLEKSLPFATSSKYGYLTACPTNVGTAMRVSVMVHLPALMLKDHIDKVYKAAQRMHHAVRGLYGEGTRAFGDMFQISNQTTLGRTETEIVDNIRAIVPKVLDYERRMRGTIFTEERPFVEDKVIRALALLRSARQLNVHEMMTHLSLVRLGVDLGIISDVKVKTINELFILGQPSHLQLEEGTALTPGERDTKRAELVRQRLSTVSN